MWQGRKHRYPVYSKLQPFGCAAWVLNLRQDRGKFDKKSELHIHLNYLPDSHAYRLMSIPQNRIIESAHVVFKADYFPMLNTHTIEPSSIEDIPAEALDIPQADNDLYDRPTRDRTPSAQFLRNIASE